MKKVSHEVVNGGGIVRGIHNHGIRTVPHRFKAAYADQLGRRYYEKVRFVSVYFDCNPATRLATEQVVRLDEHVLRQTHLRARCPFEKMNEEAFSRSSLSTPFISSGKLGTVLLA